MGCWPTGAEVIFYAFNCLFSCLNSSQLWRFLHKCVPKFIIFFDRMSTCCYTVLYRLGIRGPTHGGMHGQPLPGLLGALGELGRRFIKTYLTPKCCVG